MINSLANNPLFFIPFFVGFALLIGAVVMLLFPPGKINFFYGYRTPSSMKSQDRWVFAQRYSAIELLWAGLALMATSLLALVLNLSQGAEIAIAIGLMVIALAVILIRTERAIKAKFGSKSKES